MLPRARISLLFLGSNPEDQPRLALTREYDALVGALDREFPRRFSISSRWERPATSLPVLLDTYQPQIVHFSGHGSSDGELFFADERGGSRAADPDALARLFELHGHTVRCVVLCTCNSDELAARIAKHVDVVVGMHGQVEDDRITQFTAGFYRAVGEGDNLERAFERGKLALALDGGDADALRLVAGAAVDTARVVISPAQLPALSSWTLRQVYSAAARLDRSLQWARLVETCQADQHLLFFVHGHARQGLGLFLDRVQFYLAEEARAPHHVVRVPFKIGRADATSGAEWEAHIAHALGEGRPGTAAHFVARLALHQPLLLMLGLRPLHDLDEHQREGLEEFVCETLPKLLHRANPRFPVRALVPIDHDDETPQIVDSFGEWGRAAEREGLLRYVALRPLEFPSWTEIEDYIKDRGPLSAAVLTVIKREYEDICASKYGTFAQLAERLDRHLGDI